ncbi:hypothetical protein NDU88_006545, partial [Pleurodeles waltl]
WKAPLEYLKNSQLWHTYPRTTQESTNGSFQWMLVPRLSDGRVCSGARPRRGGPVSPKTIEKNGKK